jgi:hypothetical protein
MGKRFWDRDCLIFQIKIYIFDNRERLLLVHRDDYSESSFIKRFKYHSFFSIIVFSSFYLKGISIHSLFNRIICPVVNYDVQDYYFVILILANSSNSIFVVFFSKNVPKLILILWWFVLFTFSFNRNSKKQ